MRNKKGTYQDSCLKGIEEKKSSSERATGKAAFSWEEPNFCLNKVKEVEIFREKGQDTGILLVSTHESHRAQWKG